MREDSDTRLGLENELDLLKIEYIRMSEEIRMYVKEYSPKFTIFGTLVLALFTFAFENPKYQIVYTIIPLFMFVIAAVTISQAYVLGCNSARIRGIERRVRDLNGGTPVLLWEHNMALKLFYPPMLKLKMKNKSNHYHGLNPIFLSVLLILLAVLPLIFYCLYKSFIFLSFPYNYIYTALIGLVLLLMSFQSFTFFKLGNLFDEIDWEVQAKPTDSTTAP